MSSDNGAASSILRHVAAIEELAAGAPADVLWGVIGRLQAVAAAKGGDGASNPIVPRLDAKALAQHRNGAAPSLALQESGGSGLARRQRELSTSTTRSALSGTSNVSRFTMPDTPKLLGVLQQLVTRTPTGHELTQLMSAKVLQSSVRGFLQRRRYRNSRELHAVVSSSVEMRCSRGRSVPGYVVTVRMNNASLPRAMSHAFARRRPCVHATPTPRSPFCMRTQVVRGGHCWEVTHRFSDWHELNKRLRAALAPDPTASAAACATSPNDAAELPSFPMRLPFGGSSVVTRREYQLNRYLKEMVPICERNYRARALLLSFLCRSHMHWLYPSQQAAAQRPTEPRDVSSGFTNVSVVRDESVEAQLRRLGGYGNAPGAAEHAVKRQVAQAAARTPEPAHWPWQRAAAVHSAASAFAAAGANAQSAPAMRPGALATVSEGSRTSRNHPPTA